MRALIFLLFLILSLCAQDTTDLSKHLKSEMRAEVYAQNLVDGGYYKEAKVFLVQAREKYPNNAELMMFSGTVHYNLDELDEAKRYFVLVLKDNQNNEVAADFIAKIEEQEAAQENKVVADLFEYLRDKGLDFLMIFLAFLGGEIIAKRYHNCNTFGVSQAIKNYFNQSQLMESLIFRTTYTFKSCCLSSKVFSMCTFLDMLIVITISSAMLIVWLLLEVFLDINWFLADSLLTIDAQTMSSHISTTFIVLTLLTLFMQFINSVQNTPKSSAEYALEIAQQFQRLLAENEILKLHQSILLLQNNPLFNKTVKDDILDKIYSDDDREILENIFIKTAV